MKCYKLVSNWKYLRKNIGSFIVIALFGIYLIFFIIYLIQGIKPLKEETNKNINNILKSQNMQTNFPPKKKAMLIENNSGIIKKKKNKRKSGKHIKKSGNKIDKSYNNKSLAKSKTKLNPFEDSKSKRALNIKNKKEEEN